MRRPAGGGVHKMAAAEVETEKRAKRRAWGKTRHREKVVPMEVEEVGELVRSVASPGKTDLQHPELLTDDRLIEVLAGMRVQIPVYADGKPSRERLIYLFRKHVTPRPQRLRQRSKRKGGQWWKEVMEVDPDPQQESDWSAEGGGGVDTSPSAPLQRKRKLEDGPDLSEPKRPVDATCHSLSRISVADNAAESAHTTTEDRPTPTKVIKLKRPSRDSRGSGNTHSSGGGLASDTVQTTGKLNSAVTVEPTQAISQPSKQRITWP